jgi:hypothetical protein
MTIRKFAQQIEYLLFTGVIQRCSILKLHYLLKTYEQGKLSSEEMQEVIDQFDSEQI